MGTILLFFLAIAPPAALMYLIYWMDRHKPESLKNVLMAMVIGAMSTIPAIIIQVTFESVPLFTLPGIAGSFFESFLMVSPSEELAKFFFIYLFIRKKPFYNEINDGIVYYGAGAIGFALFENLFYVFDNGFTTGVLRAFTSIPIHTFCGIIIGYHAGLSRFSDQQKPKRLIFIGLFLAYLTHALFNTLVSSDNLLVFLFVPLMVVIYIAIYKILRRGRQMSISTTQVGQSEVFTDTDTDATQPSFESADAHPVTNYRSEDVVSDSDGPKHLVQRKEKWKAVISRILLISTALLWLLVFFVSEVSPDEFLEVVLGMIILTIIPFMVGLLLELSYQRKKRRNIY